MDLDSFLVSLYVLVDDWWKLEHARRPPKTGRPALLSDPEILTLAILAQWPRFRSERDFWRFAWAHLRPYFPALCSQSQLKVGASEPWSPSCASCSSPSPESSPILRRSIA
jgi:hypothetical protein